VCEVGRFGRGVPRGWDFTRDNPECDEEGGRTELRSGTKRVVDVLGETERAAEAGGAEGAERKDGGRAGGKGVEVGQPLLLLLVDVWFCVVREDRKGMDGIERAEERGRGGGGGTGGGGGSRIGGAAAAGCRPRKTPELIFRVSDTSFLQAGVRLELSVSR